jgi:hypothetical protein
MTVSDIKATPEKLARHRRGSEQRRRASLVAFRASPEEKAELEASAQNAGLTLGSFIRARVLNVHHTSARRRPSVELETIARLHAEMNRVGGNIHQILKRVNFGETPLAHEFHEALDGYREVIDAILVTLGRKKAA